MKSAQWFRSVRGVLVGVFLCGAQAVESQTPLRLQVQGMALTGTGFVGVGVGIGRSVTSRLDFWGSASLGSERDRTRMRAEGLVGFHIVPPNSAGWGIYSGAGVALHTIGVPTRGYLTLLLGIEPKSRRGPFFEVGVGGGVRLGAGYRVSPNSW